MVERTPENDVHVRALLVKYVDEAKAEFEAGLAPAMLVRYRELIAQGFEEGHPRRTKTAYELWVSEGCPLAVQE